LFILKNLLKFKKMNILSIKHFIKKKKVKIILN